ncbi:hypothetical protein TSTA_125590 [Talaromyces stipitatus ATCC 10500]|uniref:SnoaL-like domain-containing protein n=1 Tax=Talaromyces stipitatus (strain ATCC 10500 / CBS 375.48 / QM 6759 / NRRL 1006) TaxID=441959 RepID=B8MB56_TALSN|nr:uncharacterized protein TSTA_125590 [Talaromyces stipitatus ATCC 10500]EED18845.1 hypothetical protein TSTA_125590 [Talaromyces stipitatus ATCC 10500]
MSLRRNIEIEFVAFKDIGTKMRFLSILSAAVVVSVSRAQNLSALEKTLAITEIKNVQSLYGTIIDAKTMKDLSRVFTEDAVANYTVLGIGILTGLPLIIEGMTISQAHDVTQHAMTTSYVDVLDENNANSTAYLTAETYGTGNNIGANNTGQLFTLWLKYEDQFVRTNGSWKIKNRNAVIMGTPLTGNFTPRVIPPPPSSLPIPTATAI